MAETTLDTLRPGEAAHVVSLELHHPLRRRLMELGFVRGARVSVLRHAPMGDPVELRIGGTELALRRTDLSAVRVRS
ncbi:ferrous iron transport protein A [Deinococcus sp. KNUC1210]|uniref:FeoA family protein n=1 Tax=Deinococcus sp. KNUC1210 TaxID=2917691 RepID=UPI001EEFF1E6|nr:ferrous iron transport protein A [Deinococcus sp. KNUC1210]ULH14853.1 ferrous iron transport protein A [Deinococcus sp. KNUC1210]